MSSSDTVDEHTAAAEVDNDIVIIDRSCISCDKCGVASPQKCCGRCGLYYYCRCVLCVYEIYSCGM